MFFFFFNTRSLNFNRFSASAESSNFTSASAHSYLGSAEAKKRKKFELLTGDRSRFQKYALKKLIKFCSIGARNAVVTRAQRPKHPLKPHGVVIGLSGSRKNKKNPTFFHRRGPKELMNGSRSWLFTYKTFALVHIVVHDDKAR